MEISQQYRSVLIDRIEDNSMPCSPGGCWVWVRYADRRGRGRTMVNGVKIQVHRLVWELYNGTIPEGLCVCHTCDNPGCINIYHLFLGTNQDNSDDMVRKGRQATGSRHGSKTKPEKVAKGERNGTAKLTEMQVFEIRRLYSSGEMSQYQIAKKFNVSQTTVWMVTTRQHWKHI